MTNGVAPETPDLAVRRRPVQRRGIARFDAILGSARVLLASEGVEGFTIEDVAATAGIPIGSVYQYFPNKFAIVAELDARDTEALIDEVIAAASRFPTEDWQRETDRLIDVIAAHWVGDPTRRAVWLAMRSTAATRALADTHSRALVAILLPIVGELAGGLDDPSRTTVTEVIVEMTQALLHLSVSRSGSSVGDQPDPATVRELKRMLRAYLRAVALDA
jgi:AcrR family transcriptional regulator